MTQTKLSILICIGVFLIINNRSFAQNECSSSSLDTAEDRYAIGKLTECINGLQYCLQHEGFNTDEQVRAYKLIAMSYLAMDMRNSADSAIQNLFYLQPDFASDINDPDRFKNELLFLRFNQTETMVTSVSKRPEDIRFAPATTAVITQEEILQRGYTDLIDILKDVPGFDISVYYGQLYANVYQRGLRTNNTDKTLLLIDGIEDNDLWSNFADISQQYPVTNIKQVEIIYGPASTMYGPNAFSGVINVITKDAKDYLHNNRAFGLQFNAGAGSYNTKYLDLSTAYKKGIVSFSISGRVYYSDRPDLSSQSIYNFEKSDIDSLVLAKSSRTSYKSNLDLNSGAKEYLDANGITYSQTSDSTIWNVKSPTNANLFRLHYDKAKGYDSLILLDAGITRARMLDTSFDVPAQNKLFRNAAHDYYIDAKLAVGDMNLGIMLWKKQEGIGTTYSDRVAGVNGSVWQPVHNNIYLSFNRHLSSHTDFSVLANYRIHKITNDSRIVQIQRYLTGNLHPLDLYLNRLPYLDTSYNYESSEQFRTELKLIYSPARWFNLVSGIEIRSSLLQGYLLSDTATSLPEENGISFDSSGRNNMYNVNDFGLYTQGTLRTKNGFGITLGGRVNYNQIRHIGGTGWTFTPRVVADYLLGKKLLFKGIYSTGILNPSNFSKFDTYRTTPNPSLNTEYISNYELSADYQASKHLSANVDAYYSKDRNVVGVVSLPHAAAVQNQNIGKFEIFGTQASLSFSTKTFQATVNYSYTLPKQTEGSVPDTVLVYDTSNALKIDTIKTIRQIVGNVTYYVADIASHKANLIVNYVFLKHINLNVRLNYVGEKKAGFGTTAYLNLITEFPAYLIANASVSVFDLFKIKGIFLQFNCNNLLDKIYYSPGIRGARGLNAPNEILQMGRNFSIKLNYEL